MKAKFLIFISLFLFLPDLAQGWNSMCYSPTQMAALLSKPKKSGAGSTKALRLRIRKIDKIIDKYSQRLDKAEGLLEASLDSKKIKDRADVASEIRNYIEGGQDGWNCPESSSGKAFLLREKNGREGDLKFLQALEGLFSPHFEFFEILFQALVPDANAKTEVKDGGAPISEEDRTKAKACTDSKGTWDGEKCVCEKEGLELVPGSNICKCKNGGYWSKKNNQCVCRGKKRHLVNNKCSEKLAKEINCEKNRGTWDSSQNKCIFPSLSADLEADSNVWNETKCKEANRIWNESADRCCPTGTVASGKKCETKEQTCTKAKRKWNKSIGRCCPTGTIASGRKCLKLDKMDEDDRNADSNVWNETKCERANRKWNKSIGRCCPTGTVASGKKCLKLDKMDEDDWNADSNVWNETKCTKAGRKWNKSIGRCCPTGTIASGRKCLKPLDKMDEDDWNADSNVWNETKCEKANRKWNKSIGRCCPTGTVASGKKCLKLDKMDEDDWNADSNVWNETKCTKAGRKWNKSIGRCCPTGTIASGRKCLKSLDKMEKDDWDADSTAWDETKCKKANRKWNKSIGRCCPTGAIAAGKKCLKPLDKMEKDDWDADSTAWDETKCKRAKREWNKSIGRCCPTGTVAADKKCLKPLEPIEECKEDEIEIAPNECMNAKRFCESNPEDPHCSKKRCEAAGKNWSNNKCFEPCPPWKKDKAFKRNGNVHSSFCDRYAASNKRDCKRSLTNLKRWSKYLAKLQAKRDEYENRLSEVGLSGNATKTEAKGICLSCLKNVLLSSRPSTGQQMGNVLKMLTGAGISAVGYNMGKHAQTSANMLRVRQGYDAQHDYYSLQGLSMGFPYAAQGLYGMTRTNTPVGGWSCSPTVHPAGHFSNYQYGQGFNMRYY